MLYLMPVFVCARVCMCMHMCEGVCARAYVCVHTSMCAYVYVCVHVCAYVCVYVRVCVRTCVYVRVRMCVCVRVCTHLCMSVCICLWLLTGNFTPSQVTWAHFLVLLHLLVILRTLIKLSNSGSSSKNILTLDTLLYQHCLLLLYHGCDRNVVLNFCATTCCDHPQYLPTPCSC